MEQIKKLLESLSSLLTIPNQPIPQKKLFILCFALFFLAFGVKLLYWQDYAISSINNLSALAYDTEAERILEGKGILFPTEKPVSGNAKLLVHPPGYSILVAISFALFGNSLLPLSFIHQIFDSLAVVVIFLIGLELFPLGVAITGSLLAAFSPHFAYYGLNASPESPSNLLLLLAILLLIKAIKFFYLRYIVLAGILVGLSCWLRPNALMLTPFLGLLLLPFLTTKNRIPYLIALTISTALVISPITIRNFIVFNEFIPISIGVGANLLEGIADYDLENKFGFPKDDLAVAQADVGIYNRPDYGTTQWSPDGLMREKNRVKRASEAIKNNPLWFFGVMLKRVGFMLSYNDKSAAHWPLGTAIVPILVAEPSFAHSIEDIGKIIWSTTPAKLATEGKLLSAEAKISLQNENSILVITGDSSNYNDQFSSSIIPLTSNTDYVLSLKAFQQGQSAIKITSADQKDILATQILRQINSSFAASNNIDNSITSNALSEKRKEKKLALEQELTKIPFASGSRSEIKIILSNNGTALPETSFAQIELTQLGATPYTWTKPFRIMIRVIQKNLYNTKQMLPLVFLGIFLLALARKKQALALLLIVPIYFFCFQSILHTEYRYIYLIHYFLFLAAATSIYVIYSSITGLFFRVYKS